MSVQDIRNEFRARRATWGTQQQVINSVADLNYEGSRGVAVDEGGISLHANVSAGNPRMPLDPAFAHGLQPAEGVRRRWDPPRKPARWGMGWGGDTTMGIFYNV